LRIETISSNETEGKNENNAITENSAEEFVDLQQIMGISTRNLAFKGLSVDKTPNWCAESQNS